MAITESRYTLGFDREATRQRGADNARSSFLRSSFRRAKRTDPLTALRFMDELDRMGRPVGSTQSAAVNNDSAAGVVGAREEMNRMLRSSLRPLTSPATTGTAPAASVTPPPGGGAAPVAGPPSFLSKPRLIDGMPAADWMKQNGSKPSPIGDQIGPGRPFYLDPKNDPALNRDRDELDSVRPFYGADGKLTSKNNQGARQGLPRIYQAPQAVEVPETPTAPARKPGIMGTSWAELERMTGRKLNFPSTVSPRRKMLKGARSSVASSEDAIASEMQRRYEAAGSPTVPPPGRKRRLSIF